MPTILSQNRIFFAPSRRFSLSCSARFLGAFKVGYFSEKILFFFAKPLDFSKYI
jgi:hypothetical protein